MCFVRLITSGVNKVLHASPDLTGGMVREKKNLLNSGSIFMKEKFFHRPGVAQELINAANEIFLLNVDELIENVKKLHTSGCR